jgi:shikimate kinase
MNYPENIFLIGFSGSGKSTIGPLIAKELHYEFFDTDSMIEKVSGKSINDIFLNDGEPAFRKLESASIKKIGKDKVFNKVIALGGGAFESDQNRKLILETGIVVYLKCTPELIIKRLADFDDRPLLKSVNKRDRLEKVKQLLSTREPNYDKAQIVINTVGKNTKRIISAILQEIEVYDEKNLG